MALIDLDHVNIRTHRLETLTGFYEAVLDLKNGPRPSFDMGGAWLYCGERAVVHLVELSAEPKAGEPRIEHFAFRADGLAGFKAKLEDLGIAYKTYIVPDLLITQVFLRDPDGNNIEVSFPPAA